MGFENHYEMIENLHCPYCHTPTKLTFEVWEYPINTHNSDRLSIQNATIIKSPDFANLFWENY